MSANIRGKSLKATIRDIADGYITVNPLFLKPFEKETIRDLYQEISKVQIEVRGEKFPSNDANAIRERNLRLQRLYSTLMIIRHFARERRFPLV